MSEKNEIKETGFYTMERPKEQTVDIALSTLTQLEKQKVFVSNGGNYTVLSLVEKYVSLKIGVMHNTKAEYKTVINILKKNPFGNKQIDKVKLSDAKA